jgi:hypothetical protein
VAPVVLPTEVLALLEDDDGVLRSRPPVWVGYDPSPDDEQLGSIGLEAPSLAVLASPSREVRPTKRLGK